MSEGLERVVIPGDGAMSEGLEKKTAEEKGKAIAEKTERVFGENTATTEGDFQAEAGRSRMGIEKTQAGTGKLQAEKGQITEGQVRLLLERDKLETEQRMNDAGSHRKKVLAVVIGAVIFVLVVGVATWLLVGGE